jgi:hypothetical protein
MQPHERWAVLINDSWYLSLAFGLCGTLYLPMETFQSDPIEMKLAEEKALDDK